MDPLLHIIIMWPCSEESSESIKGGEVISQIPENTSWIRVQIGIMRLGALVIIIHLISLPGTVILKARTVVRVLAKTVERATALQMCSAARYRWLCWSGRCRAVDRENRR